PLLYRRQELLADRRWSVTMVAEFLPEPDVVKSLGPNRRRHSFAARRVEAIEATERFKERAAIAAEMSRKAARSMERNHARCPATNTEAEPENPAENNANQDIKTERNTEQ